MKPFFFGAPERPLFGAYDPAVPQRGPRAVVIAYPFGQEMQRAHRALRQLAVRLSRSGFATLRFDYWGTGDSGGETEDGEVSQWLADIDCAVDEMKLLQGRDLVSLIGLRLGASLAALAGARRADIDRMVLWEPVVDGRSYLEEGRIAHREWLLKQGDRAWTASAVDEAREMLGFPLTPGLQAGMEAMRLMGLQSRPAARVLVVERRHTPAVEGLRQHLAGLGATVDYELVEEPPIWTRSDMDQATVPPQTLERVLGWVIGTSG